MLVETGPRAPQSAAGSPERCLPLVQSPEPQVLLVKESVKGPPGARGTAEARRGTFPGREAAVAPPPGLVRSNEDPFPTWKRQKAERLTVRVGVGMSADRALAREETGPPGRLRNVSFSVATGVMRCPGYSRDACVVGAASFTAETPS